MRGMAVEIQVRKLARDGMRAGEIAAELALEPATVEYILAGDKEDFSEHDAKQMADIIKHVALHGENERNRLAAAQFAYEVKRGLKVPKSQLPTINILQINNAIRAAHADVTRLLSPSDAGGASSPASAGERPQEAPAPNPSRASDARADEVVSA